MTKSNETATQQYSHRKRPFDDLRTSGLLWFINRVIFHPRGFALALHYPDNSFKSIDPETGSAGEAELQPDGWSLVGDGTEIWEFKNGSEEDLFAQVQELLRPANYVPLADGMEDPDPSPEDEDWEDDE